MKNRESGFTLLELLVVVAIIGILATLALSNYAMFKGQAMDATAASDARGMAPGVELAMSQGISDSLILTGAGGFVPGALGSQFGARYSRNTLGSVSFDAGLQQYQIQTLQPDGGVCYVLANGVMTANPPAACL